MRARRALAMLGTTAVATLAMAGPAVLRAQGGAALTGEASSQAEGRMEGVVVSARREGGIMTVSVTTDAKGTTASPGRTCRQVPTS